MCMDLIFKGWEFGLFGTLLMTLVSSERGMVVACTPWAACESLAVPKSLFRGSKELLAPW